MSFMNSLRLISKNKKPLTAVASAIGGSALAIAMGITAPSEGKRNHAYLDPVGIPTICYGYTHGVEMGDYKTDEECEALLSSELKSSLATVDRLVKVELSAAERGAYADFVYNLGAGSFQGSTMLRKINAGDREGACKELPRWINGRVGGELTPLPGLVKRRATAQDICLSGVYNQ